MSNKPLIGINADYRAAARSVPAYGYIAAGYFQSVSAAGAIPIVIPPMEDPASISQTLEQYLWHHGLDSIAASAVDTFLQDWSIQPPFTRDLIPHNLVIQLHSKNTRLILIDGLGRQTRKSSYKDWKARRAFTRRKDNLMQRVQTVLQRKENNEAPKKRLLYLKREL